MRRSRLLIASLTFLAAGTLAIAAVRPAALFKQDFAKPTEQHVLVQKSAGTWKGTIEIHDPNMPEPMTTEATEVVEKLGAFWVTSRFECMFGIIPFAGVGSLGYDPSKEAYVGTWIDGMSTSVALMEGNIDKETGMMTMHWQIPGPDGQPMDQRSEMLMSEDSYHMEFYAGKTEGTLMMVMDMKRESSGDN